MANDSSKQIKAALQRISSGEGSLSAQQSGYSDTGDQTVAQQQKAKKQNPFASALGSALNIANRPSQFSLRFLQNQSGTGLSGFSPGTLAKSFEAGVGGLTDVGAKNDINFRQAVGQDANVGGTGGGALDLVGTIVTDPTTYIGGAGLLKGLASKAGIGIVERGAGKAVAKEVAEKGAAKLAPETQQLVRQAVRNSPEAAAAKGDTGLSALYRKATGREARSGAQKLEERLLGQEGKAFQMGKLLEPQGLQLGGKTILKRSTIGKGLQATGLGKVAGTKVAQGVADVARSAVVPRANIIKGLGQKAADKLYTHQAIGRALSGRLNNADVNAIKAATQGKTAGEKAASTLGITNVSDQALRIIDHALDTDNVDNALAHFQQRGDKQAYRLTKALDRVRRRSGEKLVQSGLAKPGQLHAAGSYSARILSDDARNWIKNNEGAARKILGFTPRDMPNGLLQDAAPILRRLPKDMSVQDLNKALKDRTGIDKFFSENPIERTLTRANQINRDVGTVETLKGLTKELVDGKPLAVIDRSAEDLAQLKDEYTAAVKDLNGGIAQTMKQSGLNTGLTRGLAKGIDELDRAVGRNTTKLQQITNSLGKLRNLQIAIGASARAARELGTVDNGFIQVGKDALADAKGALADMKEYGASAADIAKTQTAVSNLTKVLRANVASEAARTGTRGVQQAIGRTEAAMKAASQIESLLTRQAGGLEREISKLQSGAEKLTNQIPENLRPALAELRQQKQALTQQYRIARSDIANSVDIPAGYRKVDAGPLGHIWAPGEIADELGDAYRLFDNDEALQAFGKVFGGLTSAWRNLALNTIGVGAATSVRNAISNLIMMYTRGGFDNPSMFKPAAKGIKLISQQEKLGNDIIQAAKDGSLSKFERYGLQQAIKHGLIGSGFVRSDLGKQGVAVTRKGKIKQALDVRNAESALTTTMQTVNQKAESLTRLAMFYDQLSKGLNPEEAAQATRKALIDYQDLTKGERKLKTYAVPFYTFMSRNLPIQFNSIVEHPGRTLGVERLREAIFTNSGLDTEGQPIPDYTINNDQNPFLKVGDTTILSNLQSPLQAAGQTIQPLADILSTAPGVPDQYQTEAGLGGGLAGLSQNLGGAVPSLAKQAASEATGTDIGTGVPLDQNGAGGRFAKALIPSLGRTENLAKDLTATGDDAQAQRLARILSTLGITSTANTEARQESEQFRRARELNETAKRQGIPTLTELRDQGKAPKAKSSSKGKKSQKKNK